MSTHPHGSDTSGSESSDPTARRRRRRALLAGGLVVGLGAAATMAAYSDNEFASGKFTSGAPIKFGIQGSEATTTNYAWNDHNSSSGAAPLSFSTGFDGLQPGSSVYAPFTLRVDPNRNSSNAKISMNSAAVAPDAGAQALQAQLLYTAAIVTDPTKCNSSAFGPGANYVVIRGAMGGNSYSTNNPFTLTKDSAPTTVCIQVSMNPDDSVDRQDYGTSPVTATWKFAGAQV